MSYWSNENLWCLYSSCIYTSIKKKNWREERKSQIFPFVMCDVPSVDTLLWIIQHRLCKKVLKIIVQWLSLWLKSPNSWIKMRSWRRCRQSSHRNLVSFHFSLSQRSQISIQFPMESENETRMLRCLCVCAREAVFTQKHKKIWLRA